MNRESSPRRRTARRVPTLLGLAALVVGLALLAAVVGAFAASRCGDGGEARSGQLTVQLDAVTPSARVTTTPGRRRAHRPARPVRIEIPTIGVNAPMVALGLNSDHTLEVPEDFGDAGWWTGGARPGAPGPAIVAGHVDSHTGPAVFYRLRELRPGDVIVIDRRDGSRARFTVQGSERYPKDHFPTARVYGRTTRPTLRLITCSGDFDRATGHYVDNTVVYAAAA
ncbi:MAG TPA: class F sortase [Solirubrobacteraceae bacterium]